MAKKRSAASEPGIASVGPAPVREHRRRKVSPAAESAQDAGTTAPESTNDAALWDSAAAGLDAGAATVDRTPEYHEIATLAYSYWEERGCPNGSPDVDWLRAEQVLIAQRGTHAKV